MPRPLTSPDPSPAPADGPSPTRYFFVAGEASGDLLASELIAALRLQAGAHGAPPVFLGAGGPRMAAAGVDLAFDLTQHAVIGLWDVLTNLFKFRRLLRQLTELALARRPEVIVCVDFNGFNRRLARAIRQRQAEAPGWTPKIVQFVSPQVWASRPGRAVRMAEDFDLLLCIFPFEKPWYAQHAPALRVEFVGHPMIDRYAARQSAAGTAANPPKTPAPSTPGRRVLLLPGSRVGELRRHLPVMTAAARLLQSKGGTTFRLVLPNDTLLPLARELTAGLAGLELQIGGLGDALAGADVAIASTGTVTMECAFFGVPTVTLYRTNWLTYEIGRRIVTVTSLTMPNLLAGEPVYPEFIQHDATPANLASAAEEILSSPARRRQIQNQLTRVIASLGEPGACHRAAALIRDLHCPPPPAARESAAK